MNWEPWTGCYKVNDGCAYCYFYGPYSKRYGQNTVEKTAEFEKPFWFKGTGSLFKRDGVTQKVNPYKQGSLAKELDISILNGKKLF